MNQEEVAEHAKLCDQEFSKIKGKVSFEPWDGEPHRLNWNHAGLDCMIVRHAKSLHLCGYVGVPKDHVLHGVDYREEPMGGFWIHGGITYSEKCSHTICHIKEGEDDIWWFGFDCNHSADFAPSTVSYRESYSSLMGGQHGQTYKTIDYVRSETNKLAEQIAHQ